MCYKIEKSSIQNSEKTEYKSNLYLDQILSKFLQIRTLLVQNKNETNTIWVKFWQNYE